MSHSPPPEEPSKQLTGKQAYNVVSDTAIGVNLRWRDNIFQAAAIFVCLLTGATIGYVRSPRDVLTGALGGGCCGMLVGLFVSGIFLLIFRAVRHARGKHD